MTQPVGDLVVKIDGDSSNFEEEVTRLNRQLGMISKTADATAARLGTPARDHPRGLSLAAWPTPGGTRLN